MRIDAISKASQLYQAAKPKKVSEVKKAIMNVGTDNGSYLSLLMQNYSTVSEVKKADGRDKYEVSKSAKDYQTAKDAVKSAPDIREDKVRDIKEALTSGTYNISAQEMADKMVSKYFDSIF